MDNIFTKKAKYCRPYVSAENSAAGSAGLTAPEAPIWQYLVKNSPFWAFFEIKCLKSDQKLTINPPTIADVLDNQKSYDTYLSHCSKLQVNLRLITKHLVNSSLITMHTKNTGP